MPVWRDETANPLSDGIAAALKDLNLEDDPSFDEVLGMSFEDAIKHAMEAISTLIASDKLDPNDINTMVQVYLLGFTIGTKWGESRKP